MDPLSYIADWHGQYLEKGWWHSFDLPDGSRIDGVCDLAALRRRLAQFPIPDDLSGKRVLDIGAWDGWFTFEMERRGAEVVAIDRWDNPRFHEIRRLLHSRVDYRELDVYDLDPRHIGTFDLVLFLGVFYHLKHPLLALERVCSVSRDMALVESFALKDQTDRKLLEFFEYDEFGGQFDNWFAPTPACIAALCRTAGFARAGILNVHEYGAAVACYRKWDALQPTDARVLAAVHAENFGINFRSDRDDYVACTVDGEPAPQPLVGDFGVHPVHSRPTGDGRWQLNFKLPPGLPPGWHPVRLGQSNAIEIAVDLPLEVASLEIANACDAVSWTPGCASLANGYLSAWVKGLPRNADVYNVRAAVAGARQRVTYVGPDGQVNLRLAALAPGRHDIRISCGDAVTAPFPVDFTA